MTTAAGERLATVLGGVTAPGSFSAQRTASVDDLRVEVRGIGPLVLPVPDAQAKQLCGLGRPALYGQGERTLLDPRVRDTWAIPRSLVKLDKRRWNKTLLPVLAGLGGDLGVPSGCKLTAELHSMLVYAPGQFFVPHQDSETVDEMVGTLAVTMPSGFKGGALVVEHGGETATYRSAGKRVSFVAFYADCRHQIRPVKSGYRVVLTYNLLLRGDMAAGPTAEVPPGAVEAAAQCLDEHFTTPLPPPRWPADAAPADPPSRLVYLLDHEYTARGLRWSRLKGSDSRRAAVLREAASRTDCETVLALADVKETWNCYEPDRPWHSRRRYGIRADDDDDAWPGEEHSTDEYELGDLIDSSITLDCWIDPSGTDAQPVVSGVDDAEVCATTPSEDLRPYASEYEGYMGNYGNTMDRWYRRAALVMWPRRRAFAVRAEASPRRALDELSARVRAGDGAGAREMAATLAPFWDAVANHEQGRGMLTKALRVARALDQPALAAMLLKPFRVEMLARSHASALVALIDGYGDGWARELLAVWSGREQRWMPAGGRDRPAWVASLAPLCEALCAAGSTGTSTARLLVQDSWRWLRETVEQRRSIVAPSHRDKALGELGRPTLAVLESASVIAATDLVDEMLGFLREDVREDDDGLLPCLMRALRSAGGVPQERRSITGLDALARHCAERIEARLSRPPRGDDDWSIKFPGGCGCELCDALGGFLVDPARRTFEWPLAEKGRRHVHSRIDRAELPVTHQTRRTGRPYTLVLAKTAAVFERERQSRHRDEVDLAWLTGQDSPTAGTSRQA